MSCKILNKLLCGGPKVLIKIQSRQITTSGIDADHTEIFTDIMEVASTCETVKGYNSFNNVGIRAGSNFVDISHKFAIRYNPNFNITSENFIEYNNEKYKIFFVENVNERNRFLVFHSKKRGDKTKEANFA